MKKAIAYGITRPGMLYRDRWLLIEITSERKSTWGTGKVFGRVEGEPTNRRGRDVYGRFETAEQAQTAIEALQAIEAQHDPGIVAAREALKLREEAKSIAVGTALKNIKVHGVAALEAVQP